jgi:hypothetical protein
MEDTAVFDARKEILVIRSRFSLFISLTHGLGLTPKIFEGGNR